MNDERSVASLSPSGESGVIVDLQFLRGAAAILVVAAHLIERFVKHGAYGREYGKLAASLGPVGVETFFAISGFIMVVTTAKSFGSEHAARSFLWRRFLRIAPLYYITTAAMVLMAYVVKHVAPSAVDLGMSFSFIPYMNPDGLIQPVYGVGWTLNYEMFFYLLFGIALLAPIRWGLPTLIVALCTLVGLHYLVVPNPSRNHQIANIIFFITNPIMLYFIAGIMVALVYRKFGVWRVPLPGIMLCWMAALVIAFVAIKTPGLSFLAVTVAVSLSTLVASTRRQGVFDGWSKMAGDSSYSMYLTHSFVLGGLAFVFMRLPVRGSVGLLLYVSAASVVCLGCAWLCWRFIELPIATVVRRRQSRSSTITVAP